jgi:hypothetical protein
VTITEADWDQYEAVTGSFQSQHRPDTCLPTALKNVLDELAERHDSPELEYGLDELSEICDYRDRMGSSTEEVPERLGAELELDGYTVKTLMNCELSELGHIIQSGESSYPIANLPPGYFDTIDGWDIRAGTDGAHFNHKLVIFNINDRTVLFHDPFEAMMMRSSRVTEPHRELSKAEFYDLWCEGAHPRWLMWIERRPQTTLDQVGGN